MSARAATTFWQLWPGFADPCARLGQNLAEAAVKSLKTFAMEAFSESRALLFSPKKRDDR